jgi:hypothetical protein
VSGDDSGNLSAGNAEKKPWLCLYILANLIFR